MADFAEHASQISDAYNHAFGDELGRMVLNDIMQVCYVMDTTFDDDPYRSARNEGMRSAAIYILTQMGMKYPDYRRLFDRAQAETAKQTEDT